MTHGARSGAEPAGDGVDVAVYTVPTDGPEADGGATGELGSA
ncbi:hypothetical protein ACWGII_14940 [Streptomyces sp. NPDC054855]